MHDFNRWRSLSIILSLLTLMVVGGCSEESSEPSVAQQTIDDLQKKYDELVETELENPVQWASDDLENIGDWEYKIVDLSDAGAASMEATLNELGNERWEVFWIENVRTDYRIMLKRPSRSYLRHIPLSQIGRFVIGGGESQE